MAPRISPIRSDKIDQARRFLRGFGLEDATTEQKIFFLFKDRTTIEQALSFYELCLILHPDKVEVVTDKETGKPKEVPNNSNIGLTRQEIKNFRTNQKGRGVVLYSIMQKGTKYMLFFNITTLRTFEEVEKRMNDIINGISQNKNDCLAFLKLPKSKRKRLSKLTADEYRRELIKWMTKKMHRKRKQEAEEYVK